MVLFRSEEWIYDTSSEPNGTEEKGLGFMPSGSYHKDEYLYFIVEVLIFLPIVVGNTLIIISIIKFRSLRHKTYFLVGNLAFSDLLVGLVLIPKDMSIVFSTEIAHEKMFCLIKNAFYVCFLGTSVLNLFIISLERFSAVVFPLKHDVYFSKWRLWIMIAICWLTMAVVGFLPVLGWNSYYSERMPCNTDYIWLFEYRCLVGFTIITSISLNFIMYVIVARVAYRQMTDIRTCPLPVDRKLQRDIKRTKFMVIILGVFFVCWGPYCFVTIVGAFHPSKTVTRLRRWSIALGLLNAGLDWFVYGLANRRFREAFKSMFMCRCKERTSRLSRTYSLKIM